MLWVEHRDKGRLELNFLVPNTELLADSGRRLQPCYDRADRPRIDAWQTVSERATGLHDPTHRRTARAGDAIFVTQNETGSPQSYYAGLTGPRLVRSLKTRQDVTEALESAGLRSCAPQSGIPALPTRTEGETSDPKGAIYEQSFNAGEGLRAEIESAAAEYRRNAESRIQRAREVCQKSGTGRKRRGENQRRVTAHEQGMSAAMQSNRLSVMRMVGRTWLTITMVSGLLFFRA